MTSLLKILCGCCRMIFHMCRSCYRGQVYCSEECRDSGYRRNHREAQRKYRSTEKGRQSHCDAERRRRMNASENSSFKVVLYGTCACLAEMVLSIFEEDMTGEEKPAHCKICGIAGIVVNAFPQRGYGKVPLAFGTG